MWLRSMHRLFENFFILGSEICSVTHYNFCKAIPGSTVRFTIAFNIVFHSMTANCAYGHSSDFGVRRICLPDKYLLTF